MTQPYFNEIVNRDLGSLLSSSSVPETTDISSISVGNSVSSDKIFQSVSDSKTTSNVFGVFDTKQVVKELAADTSSPFSTERISQVSRTKLDNMSVKSGLDIVTDVVYDKAVDLSLDNMLSTKQLSFVAPDYLFSTPINSNGNYTDTLNSKSSESYGDSYTPRNTNTNPVISAFIPNSMTVSDYDSMKVMFNGTNGSVGLMNFSACQNLNDALNWSNKLVGNTNLFDELMRLIALIGKYNLRGILSCISAVNSMLSISQRLALSEALIQYGAIGGMGEYLGYGNNGLITNKYDTVRTLGVNSQLSGNDLDDDSDLLCSKLDVNKRDVFAVNSQTDLPRQSTLDSISDPVYDRSAINDSSSNEAFTNYCFDNDGTDRLISSVPDSLFA